MVNYVMLNTKYQGFLYEKIFMSPLQHVCTSEYSHFDHMLSKLFRVLLCDATYQNSMSC